MEARVKAPLQTEQQSSPVKKGTETPAWEDPAGSEVTGGEGGVAGAPRQAQVTCSCSVQAPAKNSWKGTVINDSHGNPIFAFFFQSTDVTH